MNHQFSWQKVVSTLRPFASSYQPVSYDIPFERGTITLQTSKNPETYGTDITVQVKDVFTNTNQIVCQISNISSDNFHIKVLEQGNWLKVLEEIANLIVSDAENHLAPIDDNYAFPEYANFTINLNTFPVVGGRHKKWREDRSYRLNDWIKSALNKRQYEDSKFKISASHTKRGGIRHAQVLIPPPIPMPNWRTVYSVDLRGGKLLSYHFRPGKWILYLRDLAS